MKYETLNEAINALDQKFNTLKYAYVSVIANNNSKNIYISSITWMVYLIITIYNLVVIKPQLHNYFIYTGIYIAIALYFAYLRYKVNNEIRKEFKKSSLQLATKIMNNCDEYMGMESWIKNTIFSSRVLPIIEMEEDEINKDKPINIEKSKSEGHEDTD